MTPTETQPVGTASPVELCSKCQERPRADADSTNPWCHVCKAQYQKEYAAGKDKRSEAKGFIRGAEAMRRLLVIEFENIGGGGGFSGHECAALIQQAPRPLDK